jgi:SAM-dependent methyltransferase
MIDLDAILADKTIPTPPDEDIYTGGSAKDFRQIGVDVLRSLINYAGLKRDSRVLEIGSGIGRVALPLSRWLAREGSYLGYEIDPKGVAWCKRHISSTHPNAQFVHIDVRNQYYNASGGLNVDDVEISGGPFDVAIFCSVFTHLEEKDANAYIKKMSQVLRSDGRLWGTWFLMDEESGRACKAGKTSLAFSYTLGGVHYLSNERSTAAVAYDEPLARALLTASGFEVVHASKGLWCERASPGGGYQDLLVARSTRHSATRPNSSVVQKKF